MLARPDGHGMLARERTGSTHLGDAAQLGAGRASLRCHRESSTPRTRCFCPFLLSRAASGAVVLQPCHEVAEEHSDHAAVAAPRLLTLRIVELLDQGRQTRRPQFGGPAWPAHSKARSPGSIPRRAPAVTLSPSMKPGFLGCDAEWPCDRPVLISSPNTRRRGNCSVRASSERRVFSVVRVRQRAEITRFSRREMLPLAAGRRRTSMRVRVHGPPRCHRRPRCRRPALR